MNGQNASNNIWIWKRMEWSYGICQHCQISKWSVVNWQRTHRGCSLREWTLRNKKVEGTKMKELLLMRVIEHFLFCLVLQYHLEGTRWIVNILSCQFQIQWHSTVWFPLHSQDAKINNLIWMPKDIFGIGNEGWLATHVNSDRNRQTAFSNNQGFSFFHIIFSWLRKCAWLIVCKELSTGTDLIEIFRSNYMYNCKYTLLASTKSSTFSQYAKINEEPLSDMNHIPLSELAKRRGDRISTYLLQ